MSQPHERWLQARGWRLAFDGWVHPERSGGRPVKADQAVRLQTLHERQQAEGARDRVIRSTKVSLDPDVVEAVVEAIHRVALVRPKFTTDAVLELDDPAIAMLSDLRQMGPLMLEAARRGMIEPADEPLAASRRRSSHARKKLSWHSLVYGGHAPQPERTAGLRVVEAVR